jgi:hypothetical protein
MGGKKVKTNKQFLLDLYKLNDAYRDNKFTMLEEYKTAIIKLKLHTEFGVCHMTPNSLLSNKNPCTIQSAVDKNDYMHRALLDRSESYRNRFFKLKGDYKRHHDKLLIETIYGFCSLSFTSLHSGSKPGFDSAIDKTSYWLNYVRERNTKYDDYTYEDVTIKGTDDRIKITCKKHGSFEIKASNFSAKNQGCSKCFDDTRAEVYKDNGGWYSKDWIIAGNKSKYFDSYKMYIIRCWNEDEEFYKVGRTFLTVQRRFKDTKQMPYNYEIIQIRESEDGHKIYCLEKAFKIKNIVINQKTTLRVVTQNVSQK